ncbi:hypothetical protein B0J13DRAFT_434715 [Dactylonectria estremocensis]|uniref:FAD-binding domain-containing protein n=1 Tax=Dactylonectria estremocensis TaxID=1079267 RepID=A0A9P9FCF0_9HYPO|nr:hypothetical protein B0J13DRAFT_434715 [Dactylonectria estremocensis]
MGSQPEMHVVIVGGGIAGLATAVALRSPSRRITILERSRMVREVGALLSLQPNATKIVNRWGIDAFLATAEPMPDRAFRMFNTDGELVREMSLDKKQFGADRIMYHRQDLSSSLKDAAISTDFPGRPAEIRTSCQVVGVDCEEGIVTLESGETVLGDVIIGADGIHSQVRTAVLGEERKAVPTGISAYRMLIPTEKLDKLSAPKKLLDPLDPSTTMIIGHDRRVIMGPGRGAKMYGVVALVPDEKMAEASSGESWVEPGSVDNLRDAYADFPAWLHDIFAAAPDVGLWQLRDLDPLPRWVRGRTVLIGDAAHAMLPTQGQGASQSFEDAEALRAFLGSSPAGADVRAALERVFAVRRDRAGLIQKYSREQARPGADPATKEVKLDPGQFMKYNCDYEGAADWEERQRRDDVAV